MNDGEDRASDLLDLRFMLFTGKGGVGKTTVVAGVAVEAARRGRRPLIVELGHRESMRSVFSAPEIGFSPRDVGHGVHAMSVDVDVAVVDYMADNIPSRRIAKAVTQNRVLERLFKAMPAVGEIATVNQLRKLAADRLPDGQPKWGPILVDLDATGHALMFLELRQVVTGLMGAGPMRQLIDEVADTFADPTQTRLNLVTLPSELPVTETIELYQRLVANRSVAFGRLIVNRVPPAVLPTGCDAQVDQLLAEAGNVGDAVLAADATFAKRAISELAQARAMIEHLQSAVPLPVVEIEQRSVARLEIEDLRELGARALDAPTEVAR